jgi:hypothetical protein
MLALFNSGYVWERLPRAYQKTLFSLMMLPIDSSNHSLYIHSSTPEEAIACLEFLVGLPDDHYESMELCYCAPHVNGQPSICPFSNYLLEKLILQNKSSLNVFERFTFTTDQCGILATSGTGTKIGFLDLQISRQWRCICAESAGSHRVDHS